MKKRTRKLALNRETVVTLTLTDLGNAVGGRLRVQMTGDPTECICPLQRRDFGPRRWFRIGD